MVGLPRESKISRPIISAMLVCILRGYDARCARAVQQMLQSILLRERRLLTWNTGLQAAAPSGLLNRLTQATRARVTSAQTGKSVFPGKRFALESRCRLVRYGLMLVRGRTALLLL